jgi:CHAT domain-containing protein
MDLLRLGAGWLQAWSDAQKPGEDASANWQAALQGVAGAIGKGLMAPVTALLPEGAEVAIMADPVVRILPLHLARVGDRPLVGPRAVKYAESVSFLRGAAAPEAREPGPIFVAAYSPPDARLLFAGIEAAGIAAARPGAKIVTGDQATPEAILKGIEASAVVHLCCHGNFVWMKPLDSTITLAGRELSLREISLRLQRSPCELIVFSACEIGARTSRSDESFANVLLDAGCQAFIGAMWKVNDLSTALLFAKFYELWNGAASGAASALSNAQMWLRERAGSELAARVRALPAANEADQSAVEQRVAELEKQQAPYAHERFWGGFCVTGSPFPLYRSPRP